MPYAPLPGDGIRRIMTTATVATMHNATSRCDSRYKGRRAHHLEPTVTFVPGSISGTVLRGIGVARGMIYVRYRRATALRDEFVARYGLVGGPIGPHDGRQGNGLDIFCGIVWHCPEGVTQQVALHSAIRTPPSVAHHSTHNAVSTLTRARVVFEVMDPSHAFAAEPLETLSTGVAPDRCPSPSHSHLPPRIRNPRGLHGVHPHLASACTSTKRFQKVQTWSVNGENNP